MYFVVQARQSINHFPIQPLLSHTCPSPLHPPLDPPLHPADAQKLNLTGNDVLWNYPIGCPNVTVELPQNSSYHTASRAQLPTTLPAQPLTCTHASTTCAPHLPNAPTLALLDMRWSCDPGVPEFPDLDTVATCDSADPQCSNTIDCTFGGVVSVTIGEAINLRGNAIGPGPSAPTACTTCTTPCIYPEDQYRWKVRQKRFEPFSGGKWFWGSSAGYLLHTLFNMPTCPLF